VSGTAETRIIEEIFVTASYPHPPTERSCRVGSSIIQGKGARAMS
jgi:hypothetical protein